jgi:hypothetical protein
MREKDAEEAMKLWIELTKKRAQLDAESTVHDVEQEAPWHQKAMSSFLDPTAKKITIHPRSQRWWNPNIKGNRG